MDANYNVRLSVDYLIECLPKHIDGNSCDGYYNKDIFEFIADNGLISEDELLLLMIFAVLLNLCYTTQC